MAEVRENTTVIGPGAKFKGEMTLDGPAQILGTIEGSIQSSGQITIGQGSACHATVEAGTIIVDGNVEGDLIARERLQLTGKANVTGDIAAASLVVAEGAAFVGHVSVGPEAVTNAQKQQATKTVEFKTAGKRSRSEEWSTPANETGTDWLTPKRTADAA